MKKTYQTPETETSQVAFTLMYKMGMGSDTANARGLSMEAKERDGEESAASQDGSSTDAWSDGLW